MKRAILSILAIFLLTTGVAFAQSANTTAPGPTVQREPGLTSNNLPNPGNPQTDLSNRDSEVQGTTTGTTTLQNETEPAEGMDVDIDTGDRAEGAVDVDVSTTADSDTDASGIDETGTGPATTTGTTDTYGDESGALPDTASELPLLALAGLLALTAAFMVRSARRA